MYEGLRPGLSEGSSLGLSHAANLVDSPLVVWVNLNELALPLVTYL